MSWSIRTARNLSRLRGLTVDPAPAVELLHTWRCGQLLALGPERAAKAIPAGVVLGVLIADPVAESAPRLSYHASYQDRRAVAVAVHALADACIRWTQAETTPPDAEIQLAALLDAERRAVVIIRQVETSSPAPAVLQRCEVRP